MIVRLLTNILLSNVKYWRCIDIQDLCYFCINIHLSIFVSVLPTHVRLSILKCWVLEDVAQRPPSYYGGASVLIKYNTRNHILLPLFVEWKQASLRVKWGIVLDESKLYFGRNPSESHLTPTVTRVHDGRCEHEHRPFSMLITVDVRWLSDGFRPIFWWILPDFSMAFAQLFNGFCPTF